MKLNVLFFGATADIVGKRRIEIPLTGDMRAGTLFEQILTEFPRLKEHCLLFSINQEYAGEEKIVGDGDELAIFTAVSGG